jgi:hypothetical protein
MEQENRLPGGLGGRIFVNFGKRPPTREPLEAEKIFEKIFNQQEVSNLGYPYGDWFMNILDKIRGAPPAMARPASVTPHY